LPLASRRPPVGSGAAPRARHFHADPEQRRRGEPVIPSAAPARVTSPVRRNRYTPDRKSVSRPHTLWNAVERNLLPISGVFLVFGAIGWGLLLYGELHASGLFDPAPHSVYATAADADLGGVKSDSMGAPVYMPRNQTLVAMHSSSAAVSEDRTASIGGETASAVVAREWSLFTPQQDAERTVVPKPVMTRPVRVASIDRTPPQIAARNPAVASVPSGVPANIAAKTSLVDFATAPFPYHGEVPGTDRPFLSADEEGDLRHVNYRGHVFEESQTFGDDHVLLHIPANFDPSRPAVMVVFFHGHGATLARDVRDRQQLPEQISAAGANAVLVAPQFAVDAADSSAGKFWEPDGFKRFLGEAAQKLAALYGDPRSAGAFAKMPIVLVAYSGGYGPALSVLARGGANARIHGIVLLDALYAGIDQFADWIANNRSAFFVSSYTPYTARNNAELEHALSGHSVPYSSELRRNDLNGMVAFLPAGDVAHRDFVTHAWTDNPVEDILARMDDIDPMIRSARVTAASPAAGAAKRD
jgi:hypothetical protein